MLRESRHEDVTRLYFETRSSRAMGLNVSAYVVRDVLIDTAFPDVAGDLGRWLDDRPVRGAIVTHYHEDHAGTVGLLAARQVPTWIAPATLSHLERPARIGRYRRLCWGTPQPLDIVPPPFEDASLCVIATPGHSSDHHIVCDAETGTVFGADLFLGVKVRVAHPPEREDVREQIASLRRATSTRTADPS
jgi:glyoxylase-like metal-dependent hydrolase (beta-lactamase superfamily II)